MPLHKVPWLRWLAAAALLDWLVARTLARGAIFMPKSPPVLAAYQGLTAIGQVGSALSALLALLGVLGLAWIVRRQLGDRPLGGVLSAALVALAGLSLALLFVQPEGGLRLLYPALLLGATAGLGWLAFSAAGTVERRLAALLPVLALLAGGLSQGLQALHAAARWPGTPSLSEPLFLAGELLVVLTPFGFWWAYGRRSAGWAAYLVALPPAIGFATFYMAAPSMAGILSIWSAGLTLYLPWPLYAAALWLAGATLLACRGWTHPAGLALLLLAAGGYAPQLSSQAFFGLLALGVLASAPAEEHMLDALPAGFSAKQQPPVSGKSAVVN